MQIENYFVHKILKLVEPYNTLRMVMDTPLQPVCTDTKKKRGGGLKSSSQAGRKEEGY